jgi:hypothetical protein
MAREVESSRQKGEQRSNKSSHDRGAEHIPIAGLARLIGLAVQIQAIHILPPAF